MAGEETRSGLWPAIAIAIAAALAALMVLAPLLRMALPATELPDPLADHHQDAETLAFVLAYIAVLPGSVLLAGRLADRVASRAGRDAPAALAGLLVGGLALVLIAGRAGGEAVIVALAAAWWLGAAALVAAALRGFAPGTGATGAIWAVCALAWAGAALAFADLGSVPAGVLIAGALAAALVPALAGRVSIPTIPGRPGLGLDALVVGLIALAVPNLSIFRTGGGLAGAIDNTIIQFHQNFFLGPANQVLGGGTMLVDTLSQYGVGSIYFLAGVFEVIPIGNETLALVEGVLSALMFVAAYAVLRIAGTTRLLAAVTLAVAVVALVWGLRYPLGGLLQHGAFRFGLPAPIVLGAVIAAARPSLRLPAQGLQLATLAVAALWALEAFAYCLLTLAAIATVEAALAEPPRRRALLRRWAAAAAAAVVLAHLLFAVLTLIASGELPDWGWYLNTLREFLTGEIGDLTYDFSAFSPGLALGAVYLASAIALVVLVGRGRALALSQRPRVVALAGTTAYGIALFSYLVNRSADHIVPYVALPALTLGTLWLGLVRAPATGAGEAGRRAALAAWIGAGALLVAAAWPAVGERYRQSALAHARPGGASLRGALERIWDVRPVIPAAAEGERLLERWMPGERRSVVLTSADLGIEILLRSGRANAVPLGDPWEDSFVPADHVEPLGEFVAGLEPGDRILLDRPAVAALRYYRSRPAADPLVESAGGVSLVPSGLAALQELVLREIGERFQLRVLERGAGGLLVAELAPRRG